MKKFAAVTAIIAAAAIITTGCGSSKLDDAKLSKPEPPVLYTQPPTTEPVTEPTTEKKEKSLEERVVDKLSPVTWDYDGQTFAVKTVGNDEFGYIQIPEDWFLDEDIAQLDDSILTYENEPYILNGNYAMDSMIMDKCDAGLARTKVESILREAESDQAVTEVAYEYPEIDGREAVLVEFKYEKLHKLRYTLFIANDEETEMHIISYESCNPQYIALLNSYTRKAPEGMSTDTTGTGDSTATTTSGTGTDTDTSSDTTTTATTTEAAG
ncbi:MAG: hypothetical protein IKW87_06965 [Ruminococcus sp.]|nr:hypothetical protein [Ruminococcus sp.]